MPKLWEMTPEQTGAEGEALRERRHEAERVTAPLFERQTAETPEPTFSCQKGYMIDAMPEWNPAAPDPEPKSPPDDPVNNSEEDCDDDDDEDEDDDKFDGASRRPGCH